MKFKNKYSRNGFIFGNVCRFFGAVFTLIFLPMVPNEETVVNGRFILPAVLAVLTFLYGFWRTGGIKYVDKRTDHMV